MITGMFSPSLRAKFTHPSTLKNRLIETGYSIDINPVDYVSLYRTSPERLLEYLVKMAYTRYEIFSEILKKEDWDFGMVVFVGIDRIQHLLWKQIENLLSKIEQKIPEIENNWILRYFQTIDSILGSLINEVPENTTTLIISDHGFRSLDRLFFTNTFLQNNGFLELRSPGILRKIRLTRERVFKLSNQLRLYQIISKLPNRLKNALSYKIPSRHKEIFDIDLEFTKAFQFMYRGIRFNSMAMRGEDEKKVREQIVTALRDVIDPDTKERVMEDVYLKEQIYWGPFAEMGPDLVLSPRTPYRTHIHILPQEFVSSQPDGDNPALIWTGEHRSEGILLMFGDDITPGIELSGATILDIAPTVYYLLGIPLPMEIDGTILVSAIANEKIKQKPPKHSRLSGYLDKEAKRLHEGQEEVKERLEALGYI
jgi:predicted AlkP superfamily phosphohydrolase/phosphomutase